MADDHALPEGLSGKHTRIGDDGTVLVNRAGLAELTGYTAGTLTLKAVEDKDRFPPVVQAGPGRSQWSRLDDALAYAAAIGTDHLNPDLSAEQQRELLDEDGYLTPEALAVLLDCKVDTIYGYITRDRPKWDAGKPGTLAIPDLREARGEDYERLGWRLETVIAHRPRRIRKNKGGRQQQAKAGER